MVEEKESWDQGISKICMVYGNCKSDFELVRYLARYLLFYYDAVELNVFDSFTSELNSEVRN